MASSPFVQIQMPVSLAIAPAQTDYLPFRSRLGYHVFVVDGSQVFDVEPGAEAFIVPAATPRFDVSGIPAPPPLQSLSLNLAQACNLGCTYCYASGGAFGKAEARMDRSTALRSVDLLLEEAGPDSDVLVGFMGGEPLMSRGLLHEVTRYAAARGEDLGVRVRFSLTTNGTLLNDDDARLFSEYDWTVQISIDGRRELHDKQRPSRSAGSAYDGVLRALERIARAGRPRTLSARSTIAEGWESLPAELDHLIGLGFDEAGFSPVLASATPGQALSTHSLERFLAEMIECGERAIGHWTQGRRYPFSNLHTALEQIHKGAHQPYPCGAGAGYLSVGAQGRLFACHRFVNDEDFSMGSVTEGPDDMARTAFLTGRHVDRQQPCASCWARYLCGGGCHHEVVNAGRFACEYVRGWLTFCLRSYVELHEQSFFAGAVK